MPRNFKIRIYMKPNFIHFNNWAVCSLHMVDLEAVVADTVQVKVQIGRAELMDIAVDTVVQSRWVDAGSILAAADLADIANTKAVVQVAKFLVAVRRLYLHAVHKKE